MQQSGSVHSGHGAYQGDGSLVTGGWEKSSDTSESSDNTLQQDLLAFHFYSNMLP